MKMFDINGDFVKVNICQSQYPIRHKSKSKLQQLVGEAVQAKWPRSTVLEEFTVPGSRLSVDFFIPDRKLVLEISPSSTHLEYTPIFHGGPLEGGLAKQKIRDGRKSDWCELNGFKLIDIRSEKDIDKIWT